MKKTAGGSANPLTPEEARKVLEHSRRLARLQSELRKVIVGQGDVVTEVLAAVLAEGHCLLVGVPGLAKTLMIRSIASLLSLSFKRIQFTPDLMPSDITGATLIHNEPGGERDFRFLAGPIFANIILADEINRTPPKTQAALMEAMEERQVTAGGRRLPLERPFLVLATQNPIEHQGTYPLPVSQLDRFFAEVRVDYPRVDEEFLIVLRTTSSYSAALEPLVGREDVLEIIELARRIDVPPPVLDYAAAIVRHTRPATAGGPEFVREWLAWGAGPRAVQCLIQGAKAVAFLGGRTEASYEDVHRVVRPVLRHRLVLNYHAEAEGLSPDHIIEKVLVALGRYEPPAPAEPARKGLLSRFLSRG